MKIKFYELISLIYYNQAPKKVKYENEIYEFNKGICNYFCEKIRRWLLDNCTTYLNEVVEILPDDTKNDEWEDIEEPSMLYTGDNEDEIMRNRYIIKKLIKNQKYLKERLDKNE